MASSSTSQHRCVFVGNIPYDATEEQLIQICEEVGPVVSFRLVLDRETGKPKGYGFCEYNDEETALSARRNLQGYEINGRQLRVDFAENDKGADRNREQGRGGPGLTQNAHKHPILGDSSLIQPIGLPLAASAASAMAQVLGGTQTMRLPLMQNGLQNMAGLGNDPLTQYLAKMSRQQLNEIMSELKVLTTQNKALAQQLLQGCPQLLKAIFQAEIMLGMVTPQMMQMAKSKQPSSSVPQTGLQNVIPSQNPLRPSHLGQTLAQKESLVGQLTRPQESQVSSALQPPVIFQQSSNPFQHVPVQPQFQPPLPPQPKNIPQGSLPGKSEMTAGSHTFPSFPIQPQMPTLLTSQVQPPLPQHSRNLGASNVSQHSLPLVPDNLHKSYLTPPLSSQGTGSYASSSHDRTWASRGVHSTSGVGLGSQTGAIGETSEVMNHQSKRQKLGDGGINHLSTINTFSTISSVPAQPIAPGPVPAGSQMTNTDRGQNSEKQMPQLPPEVESALLQQVMSLTPEQLSSLPLEQQQQVLQLQQMLVKQNL